MMRSGAGRAGAHLTNDPSQLPEPAIRWAASKLVHQVEVHVRSERIGGQPSWGSLPISPGALGDRTSVSIVGLVSTSAGSRGPSSRLLLTARRASASQRGSLRDLRGEIGADRFPEDFGPQLYFSGVSRQNLRSRIQAQLPSNSARSGVWATRGAQSRSSNLSFSGPCSLPFSSHSAFSVHSGRRCLLDRLRKRRGQTGPGTQSQGNSRSPAFFEHACRDAGAQDSTHVYRKVQLQHDGCDRQQRHLLLTTVTADKRQRGCDQHWLGRWPRSCCHPSPYRSQRLSEDVLRTCL